MLLLWLSEVMVVAGGVCQPERRRHLKPMAWRYEYLPGRTGSRILVLALTWLKAGGKEVHFPYFWQICPFSWGCRCLFAYLLSKADLCIREETHRVNSYMNSEVLFLACHVEKWMCSGTLSRFLASSQNVCVYSRPFSCYSCSPFG